MKRKFGRNIGARVDGEDGVDGVDGVDGKGGGVEGWRSGEVEEEGQHHTVSHTHHSTTQ